MTPSSRPRRWASRLLAAMLGTTVAGLMGAALLVGVGWSPARAWPQQQAPRPTPEEREQAALAELRARVQPKPPSRPLERRTLRVASTTTAGAELLDLRDELRALAANLDRGAVYETWRQSADISERLALFPWRFGLPPREADLWDELALAAEQVLDRVEGREQPALVLAEQDSYAQLLRSLLLDLAGRAADAETVLAGVESNHWCGNCGAERQGVIDRRRSEAAERRGDVAAALSLMQRSILDSFGFGSEVDQVDAVSCTRLGLLLARSERQADAVLLFQLVVDLRPGTPSAEVARGALVQMEALTEPTLERLESVYIAGAAEAETHGPRQHQRQLALAALAHVAGGPAFERLAERYEAGEEGALAGLVELRDERARPYFERALAEDDARRFETALRGLSALEGGAKAAVEPMLRRLTQPDESSCFFNRTSLDTLLRTICGGGPELPRFDRCKVEDWARDWIRWLGTQPR